MPYCSNCGAEVKPGSRFCPNCGQSQTSAPQPQPVMPSGEYVISGISGLMHGLLGREYYVLLMTQQRLMFVKLDSDERKEISKTIMDSSKEKRGGILGNIAAGLNATYNLDDYFLNWSPQQVEARYNDVFSVSAHSVNEVRVKKRDVDQDYNDDYEFRIKSPGYNEKFRFTDYRKEHSQTLKMLLGGRFKSSTWFL